MMVDKGLKRQKTVFDKKRMDIALKSHRVAMPPGGCKNNCVNAHCGGLSQQW